MRKLGVEHLPLLEKLIGVLDGEPDPVNQQIAFELLVARHVNAGQPAACRTEVRPRQYAQAHPANLGRPGSRIELGPSGHFWTSDILYN